MRFRRPTYELANKPSEPIPADEIDSEVQSKWIDLISEPLGGRVLAVSDEWFAPAKNLLNPKAPIYSDKQVYTGQWMDGWETRRHNRAAFDYAIIRLGVGAGRIRAVEIDTTHFHGNEAPAVSVEACVSRDDNEVIGWGAGRGHWEVILSKQPCQPSTRHAWRLLPPAAEAARSYTHVRLNMYPDGGIARFCLWGEAVPVLPADASEVFDLAAARNGGVVTSCSGQAFDTRASNLLLPGRGPDMADGWETARSRDDDHVDWAVVRLAAPALLQRVVVDTAHFRGNFPDEMQVEAVDWCGKPGEPGGEAEGWVVLTERVEGRADAEHELESTQKDKVFTHVKLNIWPDGGVKRLRVFGTARRFFSKL